MHRNEAMNIIAHTTMLTMPTEARLDAINNWWTIHPTDPGYKELNEALRTEVESASEPQFDPTNTRYNDLIELGIKYSLVGTTNSYLELTLERLGVSVGTVEGEVEPLEECPCCAHRTLTRRGQYDICPVCFWEDDGTASDDAFSSPNRMQLGEAKFNFAHLGAISESAKSKVLPDGPSRYPRARTK